MSVDAEPTDYVSAPRAPRKMALTTVPVYFHVISEGIRYEDGNVTDKMIRDQIDVLNRAYSGAIGGASSPFRFELVSVTRTINPDWYRFTSGSKDAAEVKRALHQGGASDLNIYTGYGLTTAGFAAFPWQYGKAPTEDGVYIDWGVIPGGDLAPYNTGLIMIHEVGHWLGLYHTFHAGSGEHGCNPKGDLVADTPAEAGPAFACEVRDSCPHYPGLDPTRNFMDAGYLCFNEFTPGQVERMIGMYAAYRAVQ